MSQPEGPAPDQAASSASDGPHFGSSASPSLPSFLPPAVQGPSYAPPPASYPPPAQAYPAPSNYSSAAPNYPPPANYPPQTQAYPTVAPSGYRPPPAPRPQPARRPRLKLWATLAVLALILGLAASAIAPGLFVTTPTPSATRTTPATGAPTSSARPIQTTTTVVTGSLGEPLNYTFDGGAATGTVESATWKSTGLVAPDPGQQYLIIEVSITATSGRVPTGWLYLRAVDTSGERHSLAIGPELTDQLRSITLTRGQSNRGQVGYELPRGPVTVEFCDNLMKPVASVTISG